MAIAGVAKQIPSTSMRGAMSLAYSALHAHNVYGRAAMENLANQNTVDKLHPYQKTATSFKSMVDRATGKPILKPTTHKVPTSYVPKYDPSHPAADQSGMVHVPDIDIFKEVSELRNANQSSKVIAKGIEMLVANAKRVIQLIGS